ncbi:MAG: hypothetical protein HZA77_13150 [Candidatus Schekmanbacteria bacterium]|nr:hypothetical protein [Candidatus Schekmanbacteria bacterium]
MIVGAIVQTVVEIRASKEEAKSKYVGIIKPPSKVLFSAQENTVRNLELGDSGAILAFSGQQGAPLFKIFGDNALTIISDKGTLKVSTTIRNRKGTIVAELINNEWKVNKNNTFDRNYSKNAIEVKDDSGDIVLQVKVLEDRIQFQGKFYDGQGNGVGIGKAPSGQGGIIVRCAPNDPGLDLKIEPMFKYPSDNHIGEFREE